MLAISQLILMVPSESSVSDKNSPPQLSQCHRSFPLYVTHEPPAGFPKLKTKKVLTQILRGAEGGVRLSFSLSASILVKAADLSSLYNSLCSEEAAFSMQSWHWFLMFFPLACNQSVDLSPYKVLKKVQDTLDLLRENRRLCSSKLVSLGLDMENPSSGSRVCPPKNIVYIFRSWNNSLARTLVQPYNLLR